MTFDLVSMGHAMNEIENMKPPYVTVGPTDRFLDLLRRQTPQKIDSKYIVDNELTSAPNAWTLVRLAEWLGFVTSNGEIVQERVRILKLSGAERDQQMANVVKEAYKDLFEVINVESANREDISNFFVNTYNFGHRQKEIATTLFLHLCQIYSIPLAEDLKKRAHPKDTKRKQSSNLRKSKLDSDAKTPPPVTKPANNDISLQREGVGIEIAVRSFGMEANPQTTIIARDKQELEDKLEGEFKAFMEYVKILLSSVKDNDKQS